MNLSAYESQSLNHNFGTDVDELVKIKEASKINLSRTRIALLDAGVKVISNGELIHLPNLDVAAFQRCNNQEFSWEVEYKDGSILKQFDGNERHDYSHINHAELKEIRWISNFADDTSNKEKRVVFTMDWATGTFSLLNGGVLQFCRAAFGKGYIPGANQKLILKMVKRQSVSVDISSQQQGEVTLYNRYLLGWEDTALKAKTLFCVEPNGYVHLWHEQ